MKLPLHDSPFIVGIDLGTTNSSIAQIDGDPGIDGARSRTCPIAQLVNPAEVDSLPLLPSFLYVAGDLDFPKGSLALPWSDRAEGATAEGGGHLVVGELARKRGAETPSRLVASAKSWLSYAGRETARRRSCRGARRRRCRSCRRLHASAPTCSISGRRGTHASLRDAGTRARPTRTCSLTVPASFDEEARELTLRAAAEARPRAA